MGQYGIGQPVRRKEDFPHLTGQACFTDDLNFDHQLFACFLRAPLAHATIVGIDTAEAQRLPGVRAVITGADLAQAGLGTLASEADIKDREGRGIYRPARPVLPVDRVRFVGEPVAMVVAESLADARTAVERIDLKLGELPAVTSAKAALDAGAALVWQELGRNVAVHWQSNDPAVVDAAISGAARRVSIDLVNNRLIPSPMEPRVALATYDSEGDNLTLYAPTQGGRRIQERLARDMLRMPVERVRVVSSDTGGAFGIRSKLYPEMVLVAWAARELRRPVKWRADRSETFVSDYHGRDQVSHAEMGLNEDGRVVALKVDTLVNVGAFLSDGGPRMAIQGGGRIIPCAYDIENFHYSVRPVFTHTVPTDTYRGAGRPEANFIMERLMDLAAVRCGLTRDEVRRRNLIRIDQLPYRTHLGLDIDSGNFAGTMEKALDASGWRSFGGRRRISEDAGKLRGIGLANFLEGAGGRVTKEMRVRLEGDGSVTVYAGTYSHGQGHDTVYAQLIAEFLGVDFERIRVVQGDTEFMPAGAVGTFGSRSSMMGGGALKFACHEIIAQGRVIAARLLQAEPDGVAFRDGVFRSEASSVSLDEVARAAEEVKDRLPGASHGLDASYLLTRPANNYNYPNGCHVCEVEVDPETGLVDVVAYTAVDDCGVVLNPLIVHGQVHGGVAQGIGQALSEGVVHDASGQLLSGSFMDYGMPRAEQIPGIGASFNSVPCKTNILGVKGAGEAGTCGAPPAVVSAVLDALRPLGVTDIEMPLTPARVWHAIQAARPSASRQGA